MQMQLNREEYWRKGYTVFRDVFPANEVSEWRREIARLWSLPGLLDDLNLRTEYRKAQDGTPVLDRLDPVLDLSPLLKSVALDQRLLAALQGLFDGKPSLLKCKLIRKDPGVGGYLHHQDFLYWRWLELHPDRLCSVGICVNDSNATSGGIEMFPARHERLWPDASGSHEADLDAQYIDFSTGEVPDLRAGDIIVFHSLTPHRSGPNASSSPRTLILPSYVAGEDAGYYGRYYRREVGRRCSSLEGFEGFNHKLDLFDADIRSAAMG